MLHYLNLFSVFMFVKIIYFSFWNLIWILLLVQTKRSKCLLVTWSIKGYIKVCLVCPTCDFWSLIAEFSFKINFYVILEKTISFHISWYIVIICVVTALYILQKVNLFFNDVDILKFGIQMESSCAVIKSVNVWQKLPAHNAFWNLKLMVVSTSFILKVYVVSFYPVFMVIFLTTSVNLDCLPSCGISFKH